MGYSSELFLRICNLHEHASSCWSSFIQIHAVPFLSSIKYQVVDNWIAKVTSDLHLQTTCSFKVVNCYSRIGKAALGLLGLNPIIANPDSAWTKVLKSEIQSLKKKGLKLSYGLAGGVHNRLEQSPAAETSDCLRRNNKTSVQISNNQSMAPTFDTRCPSNVTMENRENGYFLVGGLNPSEKYESQLGWWHSQYMGKSNWWQPNHQPVLIIRTSSENGGLFSHDSRRVALHFHPLFGF